MIQRAIQFVQKETLIWGPILLFATFAIAFQQFALIDLICVATLGFFLASFLQVRGFVYAAAILGVYAAIKHAFFIENHLWNLGIEASLGLGFFITALAFEEKGSWIDSLKNQIERGKASFSNVEEELAKQHSLLQEVQIHSQERIEALQKELEDLESEHSSILILNEVLRKKTARFEEDNKNVSINFHALQKQMEIVKGEYATLQKELEKLANTDEMARMNSQLMQELNQARFDREQTQLTFETLERQHLKEHLKAKEAEEETCSLKELLSATHKELRSVSEPLEEKLEEANRKIKSLSFEFEKACNEVNLARDNLVKLDAIQTERNFLKERLQLAQEELKHAQRGDPQKLQKTEEEFLIERDKRTQLEAENAHLRKELEKQVQQIDLIERNKRAELEAEKAHLRKELEKQIPETNLIEELQFAQDKMAELAQIEPLYKQLKKQFEEKKVVLEETRRNLFRSETELEKLKIECKSFELSPIPKDLEEEFAKTSDEIQRLEEENKMLQEIITELNKPVPQQKKN